MATLIIYHRAKYSGFLWIKPVLSSREPQCSFPWWSNSVATVHTPANRIDLAITFLVVGETQTGTTTNMQNSTRKAPNQDLFNMGYIQHIVCFHLCCFNMVEIEKKRKETATTTIEHNGLRTGARERMKEVKKKAGAEIKLMDDLWWKIILISSDRKLLLLTRRPHVHTDTQGTVSGKRTQVVLYSRPILIKKKSPS